MRSVQHAQLEVAKEEPEDKPNGEVARIVELPSTRSGLRHNIWVNACHLSRALRSESPSCILGEGRSKQCKAFTRDLWIL